MNCLRVLGGWERGLMVSMGRGADEGARLRLWELISFLWCFLFLGWWLIRWGKMARCPKLLGVVQFVVLFCLVSLLER
ncbi:hypothetical protein B0T16DRAFT_415987 [Cercophora newfieldiana]|uniref:Uncharacterized protein n=1 Tax=Cercophora newfieldiana TaxID=92897 RepID=A0AA40CM48_9PEZI|nr:hypothetical protein B0T16DRAFT_415987 [Cercophora newfieldiana]